MRDGAEENLASIAEFLKNACADDPLVLKRIAFWIPLLGILLIVGVFIGGFALTASGVTPATP